MNSTLRTIGLIARREFVTRVRTRVFTIGTAIVLVGITAYLAFQILVLSKQTQTANENVAFVGEVTSLASPFTAAAKTLDYKIVRKPVAEHMHGATRRRLQEPKLRDRLAALSSP